MLFIDISEGIPWEHFVEQELFTRPRHLNSSRFSVESALLKSLVCYVVFCRLLFVLLFFFFRPLYCMSFCSFSFGHCIVCHFVLFLSAIVFVLFLSAIVLFVLLFFFFRPLYCTSFCSFSFGHCIVCPSLL